MLYIKRQTEETEKIHLCEETYYSSIITKHPCMSTKPDEVTEKITLSYSTARERF